MNKYLLIVASLFFCFQLAEGQTAFINKVYDFYPAPGQQMNKLPKYDAGDTKVDIIQKVEDKIKGEVKGLISLGAYGGSVTFGFDHMVQNVAGKYDFKVWGNAFYSSVPDNSRKGGSCEPGIVMVSYDANGNGLPDDAWYELAGSEYHKPETVKNYKITYFKPDPNKTATPSVVIPSLIDSSYIKWTSNQGDSGFVAMNTFNRQSYYPLWESADSLVFEGTKLANNYTQFANGGNYAQYAYDWGYVDNHPNNNVLANMNIEWAVDANGNAVNLPGIHFVKVYTGVNQYVGMLGETSTEVSGAEDLHMTGGDVDVPASVSEPQSNLDIVLLTNPVSDVLKIASVKDRFIDIYDINGKKQFSKTIVSGTNDIDCSQLSAGFYIVKHTGGALKFVKK